MRPRAARGSALLAAVALLAFCAALSAALADLARTELQVTSRRRTTAELLAAADACLAEVTAALPAGWDFAAVLAGPDGVAGTADDGALAAPAGCAARAAPAPGGPAPDRVLAQVTARRADRGRNLEAVVRRAPEPGAGALVWLAAPPASLGGTALLDGADAVAPEAALAAPVDPEALDAWVVAQGARLTIAPRTLAPLTAPAPPLAELAARAAAGPHAGAEALGTAPPAGPSVAWVAGDLLLDDARWGAGLLVVEGVLEVTGALAFSGVVAATGGLRVGAGATVVVAGALWLGDGVAPLSVDGALEVRRDAAAVSAADAMLLLPRRAVPGGARDVG